MNKKLSGDDLDKFSMISTIDFETLKKKTDKFRLLVDLKKVRTYDDLKVFYDEYKEYLCELSKHQIDLMLMENKWTESAYFAMAVNKFKNKK